YKILIAGVDSVAVAQVSGLLNMAATMEGRLGYTPGAYALSGEGETVISPCVISDGFIENPDDYETDLILGLDLAAAANASTLTTLPSTKTNVVVNRGMISTTTPSPLFLNQVQDKLSPRSGGGVMESGKMEEQDRLIEEIDSSIRSDNILYLDAGYLAERIMGDQQMSHLFILGFAYQAGLLPVKVSSLEEAIHQDGGVAAQEMVSALEWGRIYYLSPHMALEEIEADHWSKKDPKERTISKLKMERPSAIPEFEKILSEIKVEDRGLKILLYPRIADLILYQDSLYAREYVRSVMSVMGREKEVVKDRLDLTMAVARSLFKLMAYKDEYEAARLHLTRANRERIASVFGKEAKVFWCIRPPWSKNKSLLGGWFMPVLSILASLRWMRRYRINPFGSSPIRRMEQDLPSWYREVIDTLILELHQGNYPLAVRIASSPDKISGYGMVKIASIKEVISEVERDLSFLNGEDLSDIEPLYEEASAN
ncbi:MAG: hypothetical protein HZA13_02960, partial [Nitrospirae bacterium]|nr:hypothetical protein [Nitrospirota bacterium]